MLAVNLLFMDFEDPMDNGDITTLDFEHDDLANTNGFLFIISQEQQVTSVERWLHTTTENMAITK